MNKLPNNSYIMLIMIITRCRISSSSRSSSSSSDSSKYQPAGHQQQCSIIIIYSDHNDQMWNEDGEAADAGGVGGPPTLSASAIPGLSGSDQIGGTPLLAIQYYSMQCM